MIRIDNFLVRVLALMVALFAFFSEVEARKCSRNVFENQSDTTHLSYNFV